MVGDPKALAQDPRDLVEFVSWILDVERGDRTWPRSRYHYAARGNSQMLKVMKDYVIPHSQAQGETSGPSATWSTVQSLPYSLHNIWRWPLLL